MMEEGRDPESEILEIEEDLSALPIQKFRPRCLSIVGVINKDSRSVIASLPETDGASRTAGGPAETL